MERKSAISAAIQTQGVPICYLKQGSWIESKFGIANQILPKHQSYHVAHRHA